MRPAGNDNKGAMKLRVDFKKKHPGSFCFLDTVVVFDVYVQMEVLTNAACMHYSKINPQTINITRREKENLVILDVLCVQQMIPCRRR